VNRQSRIAVRESLIGPRDEDLKDEGSGMQDKGFAIND
jgi:hypothetical protein